MSFLKKLFGGDDKAPATTAAAEPAASVEHMGFTIHAEPYQEQGQFQTAGRITKEVDGEVKTHRFVRADRHAGKDDAVEFTLRKGKQIVEEQGERLFK
jgi:hypothetical protein